MPSYLTVSEAWATIDANHCTTLRGASVSVSLPSKQVVAVEALEDPTPYSYSHCVRVGPFVYIAGQCGLGTDHEIVSPDFEPQARAALDRVRVVAEAAGGSLDDIVAMTVFITDIRLGRVFTALRKEYFGARFPTSALIGVSALVVSGAMIEIQAIAIINESAQS